MVDPRSRAELNRRTAIKLGGMTALGAGLSFAGGGTFKAVAAMVQGSPQPAPQIIASQNGVLEGLLQLTPGPAWIAGDMVADTMTYNGQYPGPTLLAKPGDRVRLVVKNDLASMTNTHFHGLHVTPEGQGDNVFAMVPPGGTFQHDFVIPANHPGGLYWYHPHHHGDVDTQIYHGAAGLLVIEGGAASLPALAGKVHRLMALKNAFIQDTGSGPTLVPENLVSQEIHTINGQLLPTIDLAPGETQLWQIANIGNDPFYRIGLDDHELTVVSEDGALLWDTFTTTELVLAPGKRFEVAVTGGAPGPHTFWQLGFDQGPFGMWPKVALATVNVAGTPQTPATVPAHPAPRVDLANEPIAARRTITLSEALPDPNLPPQFFVNGVQFQNIVPGDVIQVELGTTEEWVVRNDPSLAVGGVAETHPYHIHVNPFVVVGEGTWDPATGQTTSFTALDPKGTADVAVVPPGGYLVMRQKYLDYTGKSVLHCHITFHEDQGMMAELNINAPAPAPANPAPSDPVAAPAAAPVRAAPRFSG